MDIGVIAGGGFSSGLNLYATVVLLGVTGRLGWADTPDPLQQWWLIGAAGAAYAVEFVADKVPYLDNAWDLAHTVIRPAGAAWVGVVLAGEDPSLPRVGLAVLAGGLALSGHAAKASTRAAVNVSPEPFSNIALSLFEDGVVVGLVSLALAYPEAALVVALVAALVALAVTVLLWRFLRRLLGLARRFRAPRPA
jgi:hypothetical protein